MAETKIEWTATVRPDGRVTPGYTFNHVIGCQRVAVGCEHCYAEAFAKRTGMAKWGPGGTRVKTSESYWRQPLKWNREAAAAGERRRVFTASLSDVFESWDGPIIDHRGQYLMQCDSCVNPDGTFHREPVSPFDRSKTYYEHACGEHLRCLTLDDVRADLFKLIDTTPWLDWMVLTKRPENIKRMLTQWLRDRMGDGMESPDGAWRQGAPVRNLWLGTSIANQNDADRNIPSLLECRDLAPVLFVSAEPLIGPVDFRWKPYHHEACGETYLEYLYRVGTVDQYESLKLLDLLIVGGESGGRSRPCEVEWIRSLIEQCRAAGVACFAKQLGRWPVIRQPTKEEYLNKTAPEFEWPEGTRFGGRGSDDGEYQGRFLHLKDSKGGDWLEWPQALRVRQMPTVEATR